MTVYIVRGLQKANHYYRVDSSHIGGFSLEGDDSSGLDFERQQKEEAEMVDAMKKVEKMRLEMQRANERIQAAQGIEGTVIKKKKKKVKPAESAAGEVATVVKKKKPKKAATIEGDGEPSAAVEEVVKPKKKKKKPKTEVEEGTVQQKRIGYSVGA